MTEQRKITVVIDALGRPKIEAIGFNGMGCEAATKPIEDALAGKGGVSRTYKPEWANMGVEEKAEEHQQW